MECRIEKDGNDVYQGFPKFDSSVFHFRDDFSCGAFPTRETSRYNIWNMLGLEIDSSVLNLPVLAAYELGKNKVSLDFDYIRESAFDKKMYLEGASVPEFLKDVWTFDSRKSWCRLFSKGIPIEVKSKFRGDLSVLERELVKGYNVFGDNMYVVALANWDNKYNNIDDKKFSLVGHISDTGEMYLVGTTVKGRSLVNGKWGIDFNPPKNSDGMIFPQL